MELFNMLTEQQKKLLEYLQKREKEESLENFMELRRKTFRIPIKDRPNGKVNKIYS